MPDRPTHLRTHRRGAAGDGPGEIAGNPGSAPASDAPTVEELKTQLDAARAMAAEHLASQVSDILSSRRASMSDKEV